MAEIIMGIDHGNGNMKGVHVNFPCGLVRYTSEPGRFMNEDILEYNGVYYTLSETRMPFKADKTVDEDYFILEPQYKELLNLVSKKITKQGTDSEGKTEKKIKLIYCSSDRIGVKDTYEKYLGDEIVIGKNCDYVFHYLNAYDEMELDKDRDFVYDSKSKLTFGGQVNFWLNKIMGYQVKAREIEKTEFIQVLYRNEKVLFEMRPKNVGTGVTYITELIIAALACKEGDLLIIENPEIHLHPSGQSELVEFLAFLAQCGVQIIVETHSDHIYNGIRKSIRLDQIDSDKVNIYSFTQDTKGCSIPIKIPVNGDGKALNNAEGFFDQIDKDLNVILGW